LMDEWLSHAHGSQLELISWLMFVKSWTGFAECLSQNSFDKTSWGPNHCPSTKTSSIIGPNKQCLMLNVQAKMHVSNLLLLQVPTIVPLPKHHPSLDPTHNDWWMRCLFFAHGSQTICSPRAIFLGLT
jgi:hypothetical protein